MVEIDFHSGGEEVAEVGLGGEACDGAAVGGSGDHQADVDTGEGGITDGEEYGVGRREVGGLYVEVFPALSHNLYEALHDGVPFVHGAGGDNLCDCVIA